MTDTTDIARVAATLTKAQRDFVRARHSDDGNPWPFISITQRTGGAKDRTFRKMQTAGLYDRGNCLTDAGRSLRAYLENGNAG